MTKYIKAGSKQIRKETFDNSEEDQNIITDRKIFIIVDHKHKPVFHKDGYLLIFYNKRNAVAYLEGNKIPENWRFMKAIMQIIKN